MTTQVIFNVDKELKDRAMKRAQTEGIPFGVILKLATKAFVEGKLNVGLFSNERFNTVTNRMVSRSVRDIKENKNVSPRFRNAKEAIAYLNS